MSRFTPDELFPLSSETGRMLRAIDWVTTPLGPVENWPQSLKTSISICLNSGFPILIWWGPELVMLYNDAYAPLISNKHPSALGRRGQEVFPEIWKTIGPMLDGVMRRGEAVRASDLLLLLERNGYPEECYFTFSYSPILDESGGVGGVFTPVHETTERVINERRLKTLSTLSEVRAEQAPDVESACRALVSALANNRIDLPFAALYLFDSDGQHATRVASYEGFADALAPARISPEASWPPISELAQDHMVVRDLDFLRPEEIPAGALGNSAEQAAVLPIKRQGSEGVKGFLLTLLNPRKRLDNSYASFLALVAEHLYGAIADAESFEAERKRAEALSEIDRAKTVFFSNVSHEFRTPLTLLAGPIQETLAETDLPAVTRERLELAQRNAMRLQKLVNNLLDFSRIEAGRGFSAFQPTDLVELTRDLVSGFESAFLKAGLTLEFRVSTAIGIAHVDRDHWEKIVLNLLSNAFKFTLSGGVVVDLSEKDGRFQLVVEDTGAGIPSSELANVFQRFQRIEGTVGRSFEGSGIGLALVQELVKLHGGTIRVESEEGVGSRFIVSIPNGSAHLPADQVVESRLAATNANRMEAFVSEALRWIPDEGAEPSTIPEVVADEREAALQPDRTQFPSRRHVLVVDDNTDMRRYLKRLLSPYFHVTTATNGFEALGLIRKRRPDLILSDVMMPVMDGVALLKAIRSDAHTASMPVLLLSARAGEDAQIQGLETGADDYLVKPFSTRELITRVTSILKIAEIRDAAESALRESEQELRYTIEFNYHVPWTADAAGKITDFSNRWLELTGLTREQALGDGWAQVQHPEDLERVRSSWAHSVATGEPLDIENRIRTSDGSYRWMRSRANARHDESGNIVKWYGTEEDIDDRRRDQERLQDSERRMRIAQEAAGVLIWEWCMDNGHIAWGPGVERVYGRTADELTFENWRNSLHPDDREPTQRILDRVAREYCHYDAEYRVIWPDGSIHWLIAKGETYQNATTGHTYLIGANLDITVRKQTEEALRQRDAQILEVLERTTDAVFLLDSQWRFQYLNSHAIELIAAGRDLLGKNIWEEFPDAIERNFYREYHRARANGIAVQFEEFYPAPLEKWFDVHVYPTGDGLAVFFRDVTLKKKSDAALRQSEKLAAAGRLAASIAHEINNPLEAVTNLLFLLGTNTSLDVQAREFVDTAQKELSRVSHIANQTLRFYRQSTNATEVRIEDVLDSVIALHRLRHPASQIQFQRQYRSSEPFIAFEGELRQVFTNLVSNAADAAGQNGLIALRVHTATNWHTGKRGVRVTVADNGHGMSREIRERLFEPFFSTKGMIGTGLGLWVTREIVEKHGGLMRVRSDVSSRYRGTSFSVFLPFEAATPAITPLPE